MKKACILIIFFCIVLIPQLVYATDVTENIMGPISSQTDNSSGLFLYIFLAVVYIMTIHLAMAIGDQFNIFLIGGLFILGGVVGFFINSYPLGFVLAIVLSLMFW